MPAFDAYFGRLVYDAGNAADTGVWKTADGYYVDGVTLFLYIVVGAFDGSARDRPPR